MGTSGARVDQAGGRAGAKTLRQEQLDMFMERGGAVGSWSAVSRGREAED